MEGKIDEDELACLVLPFGNSPQKKRGCVIISWKCYKTLAASSRAEKE